MKPPFPLLVRHSSRTNASEPITMRCMQLIQVQFVLALDNLIVFQHELATHKQVVMYL